MITFVIPEELGGGEIIKMKDDSVVYKFTVNNIKVEVKSSIEHIFRNISLKYNKDVTRIMRKCLTLFEENVDK